jgi:hypothetical protein
MANAESSAIAVASQEKVRLVFPVLARWDVLQHP